VGYIQRKGIVINPLILVITITIIIVFHLRGDWDNQYFALFRTSTRSDTYPPVEVTMISIYAIFSLITAIIWYGFGKNLAPFSVKLIIKIFGGLSSQPFIDKEINRASISITKFISFVGNLFLALFAVDFFLSTTVLFRNAIYPPFLSLVVALIVVSLLEPINLIYDSVGVRSYNESKSEILAVSSILGKFGFRLLQTGGLIATFASITFNTGLIDQIPVSIRVVFVRTFIISTLTLFFYFSFFQSEAIYRDWKKHKGIPSGKTAIKYR
jgi:hypothetical protein